MKYFRAKEFGGHYKRLDPELKKMLDKFRELWGSPVTISPHPDAIARTTGNGFHNYKKHGSVKAVDIMPSNFVTTEDFRRGYETAMAAGATGIGIYPDWKPQAGMHIDVGQRKYRPAGYIAKWSAFKVAGRQKYFGISRAFKDN